MSISSILVYTEKRQSPGLENLQSGTRAAISTSGEFCTGAACNRASESVGHSARSSFDENGVELLYV